MSAVGPVLHLDAETRKDLKLFEPEEGSLFDYCNRCRTDGGKRVLRRRMETPSACAEAIARTQAALLFICDNRAAFNALPSEYVALNAERYITASFPTVTQQTAIEFHAAAFFYWKNDDQFYTKIVRGVEVARRLVEGMHRLSEALEQSELSGALQPLLREVAQLTARPALQSIRAGEEPRYYWQKLRLDQTFRAVEKNSMNRILQLAYEIDALVSLADVFSANSLTMPEMADGPVCIEAEGLSHPQLSGAVANPVAINQRARVLFLTGPNMAGKTTYLRSVATALYFAQLGLGVAADRFRFVPVERLFTAIALNDDLSEGVSYFKAEALRMKAIAESVAQGKRTLALLDEPFKGTNVKDAYDATLAVLHRLAEADGSLFMVTSHLVELGEALATSKRVAFGYFSAGEDGDHLTFDYRLKKGVSSQRLGMRVLQEEGVFDLLDTVSKESR